MKLFRWTAAGLILAAFSPIYGIVLGYIIASAFNCYVHDGFVQPCETPIGDLGPTLYRMVGSGWYFLMTMPLAVVTLIMWLAVEAIRRTRT